MTTIARAMLGLSLIPACTHTDGDGLLPATIATATLEVDGVVQEFETLDDYLQYGAAPSDPAAEPCACSEVISIVADGKLTSLLIFHPETAAGASATVRENVPDYGPSLRWMDPDGSYRAAFGGSAEIAVMTDDLLEIAFTDTEVCALEDFGDRSGSDCAAASVVLSVHDERSVSPATYGGYPVPDRGETADGTPVCYAESGSGQAECAP